MGGIVHCSGTSTSSLLAVQSSRAHRWVGRDGRSTRHPYCVRGRKRLVITPLCCAHVQRQVVVDQLKLADVTPQQYLDVCMSCSRVCIKLHIDISPLLSQTRDEFLKELMRKAKPLPGALEVVKLMKRKCNRIAIATSRCSSCTRMCKCGCVIHLPVTHCSLPQLHRVPGAEARRQQGAV